MRYFLVLGLLVGTAFPVAAQGDIERQRQEGIQQYREAGVPNPATIRAAAETLFAKPVAEQSEEELRSLARAANAYANYVDMIHTQYNRYRVDNLRYQFVIASVEPVQDLYARLGNEFKGIRNRAYLNLGEKAEAAGHPLEALYFYNDAFRLASFGCSSQNPSAGECPRLEAERRMQRILRIEGVQPYTTFR